MKVALVTGSSRGIGLASAKALAQAGFAVALNGPFDDKELESAVAQVTDAGGQARRTKNRRPAMRGDSHRDAIIRAISVARSPTQRMR